MPQVWSRRKTYKQNMVLSLFSLQSDFENKNTRVDMKSTDTQIKTGLKLSEAIKLLEENESALIRPEISIVSDADFSHNADWPINVSCLYSVKLPPPKSVSVTRADVFDAVESTDISMLPHKEASNGK